MATPVPVLLAVGLFAGAAAGVAAEAAGFSPLSEPEAEAAVEEPGVVLGPAVTVHDCPDGAPIAVLAGGDGVLATGRTDDGLWIEIRSPLDTTSPAWMSAGTLDPDGDLADLPVHECAVEATTTTTGSTTSTSTSSTSTSTSTSTSLPSATTVPANTTTRPAPPSSTTTAPDQPPDVGRPASNTPVIEHSTCTFDEYPKTAQITVVASDDRSGLRVTMSFRTMSLGNQVFAGGPLSVVGPVSGVYRATLGPLPQAAMTAGAPTTAEITVRAEDSGGHVVVRILNAPVVQCA